MSNAQVWKDNRSGRLGRKAGNLVLSRVQRVEKEPIMHEKGTIFSTAHKVFVARVCSTTSYLQAGIVHFCNMSRDQHRSLRRYRKQTVYLFITVQDGYIHYWTVPGKIVASVMARLTPKPNTSTCFLRITEEDGKFFLGGSNISKFHHKTRHGLKKSRSQKAA